MTYFGADLSIYALKQNSHSLVHTSCDVQRQDLPREGESFQSSCEPSLIGSSSNTLLLGNLVRLAGSAGTPTPVRSARDLSRTCGVIYPVLKVTASIKQLRSTNRLTAADGVQVRSWEVLVPQSRSDQWPWRDELGRDLWQGYINVRSKLRCVSSELDFCKEMRERERQIGGRVRRSSQLNTRMVLAILCVSRISLAHEGERIWKEGGVSAPSCSMV